mgnify:CR=1 FL=1
MSSRSRACRAAGERGALRREALYREDEASYDEDDVYDAARGRRGRRRRRARPVTPPEVWHESHYVCPRDAPAPRALWTWGCSARMPGARPRLAVLWGLA